MSILHHIRSALRGARRPSPSRGRRLRLERLEDRLTPSTFTGADVVLISTDALNATSKPVPPIVSTVPGVPTVASTPMRMKPAIPPVDSWSAPAASAWLSPARGRAPAGKRRTPS